jgi:copper chaperone CopZ
MKKLIIFLSILGIFTACNSTTKKTTTAAFMPDSTKLSTLVMKVGGMSCTGCEQTICKAVGGLNGIDKVTASYIDSITTVVYDSSLVNVSEISKKIDETGYKVLAIK